MLAKLLTSINKWDLETSGNHFHY